MENYKEYSTIVRLKILILKYGVKFEPLDLFSKLKNIEQYKIKKRIVKPIACNYQVYDKSKDETIIPSEVILETEEEKSIVKLRYSEESPVKLKMEQNGEIKIEIEGETQKVKVLLVKQHEILQEKIPTNLIGKEATIGDYIDIVGQDRISILFFEGCYNWIAGKPCKFCDLHPKEHDSSFKPTLNTLKNYDFNVEKWWKNYKEEYLKALAYSLKRIIESNQLDHIHIFFMAGNLPTNVDVWNVAEETIEYISKYVNLSKYDNYLNIAPHDTLERLEKIKKLGINQVQYNLEVVTKENFINTCPGKMDYDSFLQKLYQAVEVFGKGNVRSNFVLGLDNMEQTLKFAKEISTKGVVFDYSVFQPKKCTPYKDKKAPDFDEVIKFTKELVKIYDKNGYKPIFCSLSSRSSLVNEIYNDYIRRKKMNKLDVKIGNNTIKVNIERPELIYGIEGLFYNGELNEKQAIIEMIDKKISVIKSKETRFFIPAHNEEDFEYANKNNIEIKQVVAPYFYGEGEEKVREDKPTQKRHSVIAIIKHNVEDKYLCVDCKNRICKSFVLGGIEKGETAEQAAIREVKEETGYTDVQITDKSPFILINHFYAGYKGVNRYATLDIVFGKINSEKNIGLSEEESNKHVVKWINKEDLNKFISVKNNKFALDILLNGEKAFETDGVMINSNELNDMKSEEARERIINLLNK